MNDWIKDEVPAFAVVGKINMGKSSVLATLLEIDDDAVLRVSNTPGETTRCQILPLSCRGEEHLRFIDTPGFSRPLEAMRAIQELHGEGTPTLKTVQTFVENHLGGGEFEDEARLLEPVVQGAGVLYIIDPSKPLRDSFVAEMEIMRWTGRPRMAVLNEKGTAHERIDEWKSRLGSYFNLVRTFNAHHARFEERRSLLSSLLAIDEKNKERIEETIELLDEEWGQRREEGAEIILEFLGKAMSYREKANLSEHEAQLSHRRNKKESDLSKRYFDKITKFEEEAYGKLLKLYRHHLIKYQAGEEHFKGLDLSSQETWEKWGLSRGKLTLVGALTGAGTGLTVDIGTGGLTHGLGTLLGGAIGAGAAFFGGKDLPDLKIDAIKGVSFSGGNDQALVMGPPKNENFPWILLDRCLHHFREITERAHGRRDDELDARAEMDAGWVDRFPKERRSTLHKWFIKVGKKGEANFDTEVYQAVLDALEELEEG